MLWCVCRFLSYSQRSSARSNKQWEVLSQLPCLEILILNADGGFADPPAVDEIIWVVAQCKSLEWVDIEDNYGRFSRIEYCRSRKTSRIYDIDRCDRYIWIDDFDIFDDYQ